MNLRRAVAALRQRVGRLGSRDRRALKLGTWLVVPALAFVWLVRPIAADFTSARLRLTTERDLLARERALLTEAPAFPGRIATAEQRLSQETRRLFPGADPVSAAASLGRHIADRAERHHVLVQGSETQPAELAGDGVVRLAVQLRAIGDLAGVTAWLADLESGPRLLRIEELRIAPSEGGRRNDSADEEVLGVSLRAVGFSLSADGDKVEASR